jgi:hypothetical protein
LIGQFLPPLRQKYENLNSTGFKKSSTAFYHVNANTQLKINSKNEFRLTQAEEVESDPEIDRIIDEIDAELGFCNFTDLDEFVKFNEKRKLLVD